MAGTNTATCPYCLEKIKPGARRCPHCQSSLEDKPASDGNVVYIMDRGLVRFAKFAGGVLGLFILVGIYLYGIDLKNVSETAVSAKLAAQQAAIDIGQQRASMQQELEAIDKGLSHYSELATTLEAESDEANAVLDQIRSAYTQATDIVADMQLTASQQQAADDLAQEKGLAGPLPKTWQSGATLHYRFMGGTERAHQIVKDAIGEWTKFANLNFEEVSQGGELRFSFEPGSSWAYVGTDALIIPDKQATANFDVLDGSSDKDARQTALHEIGHVLGLTHEFQNPQAGDVFDLAAVNKLASTNGWTTQWIEFNLLKKAPGPYAWPYDPESIMNYSFPPEIFLPGKQTHPSDHLSPGDQQRAAKIYPK